MTPSNIATITARIINEAARQDANYAALVIRLFPGWPARAHDPEIPGSASGLTSVVMASPTLPAGVSGGWGAKGDE